MLCNSKINRRPDKALQSALLKLSLSLMLLAFSLMWFFIDTTHHFYSTISTSLITIYSLFVAVKTLTVGEAAISYGGFANEIISNDSSIKRIENPSGESIIQNEKAKALFKNSDIMSFLEKYATTGTGNKNALYRLQTALNNLSSVKTTVALLFNPNSKRIFRDLEYFEVSVHPIYLKKPKIFDGVYSVKHIKKETYFYWEVKNITVQKHMDDVFSQEFSSLHNFLDDLPVGLYTIDKDYNICYANNNFAQFLKTKPHHLIGQSIKDYITVDSSIPLNKESWFGPVRFIPSQNAPKETYIFQTAYREQEKNMLRGVIIHELPTPDELQQQINKSMDKVYWIFNNSPIGMIFISSDGNITNLNAKAAELFDLSETNTNLLETLTPENQDILKKSLEHSSSLAKEQSIELKTEKRTLTL